MPKKNPKPTGRPRAIINWRKVDSLLRAGCNGTEIAGLLGIHADTLYHACEEKYKVAFSAYQQAKREQGKELLRYAQFQSALNNNTTMQIWLGKQLLGQKDKQEVTNAGLPNITVMVDSPETAETLKALLEDGHNKDDERLPT
jgi:hypothetical protein